jgi:hypothetical protein
MGNNTGRTISPTHFIKDLPTGPTSTSTYSDSSAGTSEVMTMGCPWMRVVREEARAPRGANLGYMQCMKYVGMASDLMQATGAGMRPVVVPAN